MIRITPSYKNGVPAAMSLLEAEVSETLESPAVSVTASFLAEKHPGDIAALEVVKGGYYFLGNVDAQRTELSDRGLIVSVDARSAAALLLDNEALPMDYIGISLDTLFARHITPYGFSLSRLEPNRRLASYPVHKGISEWEALCGFIHYAYGCRPQVKGRTVFVRTQKPQRVLNISNKGGGAIFTKLSEQRTPYSIISRVVIRDYLGEYSTGVNNPSADGIRRTRYQIPAGELVDYARHDADFRIKQSMAASRSWGVTLPGLEDAELAMEARPDEPGFSGQSMAVTAWKWRVTPRGDMTELKLGMGSYIWN
ncbi:MAG: hypothetical protein FWH02_05820 [Oscillospiraceae bacterium]|nr:hypothetical protein [Oscillospiraceae bacterium]